jgi:glycerophosphoryl diester phosphodiesterase
MLDLKGRNPEIGTRTLDAVRPYLGLRRLTVCSRAWRLLEPFAASPHVRVVHSVGSARQLRSLLRRAEGRRLQGVSVHERLLDPATLADLRSVADVVMTWPANAAHRVRELVSMGVDGLITDRLDLVGDLGAGPAAAQEPVP